MVLSELKSIITRVNIVVIILTLITCLGFFIARNTYDSYEPVDIEVLGIDIVRDYPKGTDGYNKNILTTFRYNDKKGKTYVQYTRSKIDDTVKIRCNPDDYNSYMRYDSVVSMKYTAIIMSVLCLFMSFLSIYFNMSNKEEVVSDGKM